MAKPNEVPAFTAERVWKAIQDGSLRVQVIPGTRLLWVERGRIRLTWREDGRVKRARVRLRRVYLHPRWRPLPVRFDISEIVGISREELARKGIIRLKNGEYRQLIYQWLNDPFSLQRQIDEHIMPRYEQEEEELWSLFSQVDLRAILGLTAVPEEMQEVILGRVDQIGVIRTHLKGRSRAVEERINKLRRLQNYVRGALLMILDLIPERAEGMEGYIIGLGRSLDRHYDQLGFLLGDNPFAHSARWARYHIQKAGVDLSKHEFDDAHRHIEKAIEHLQWPE